MKKKPFCLSSSGFICFAHRGASGHEPENTLLAVEKAIAMGAPWIEIDVFAVEGELVVIHDDRLETTTNGAGYVTQQSLAYLRSLDAGKGQRIPLLREVFDLAGGRVGVNVELKGPETAAPVMKLINEYERLPDMDGSRILVSSFNRRELIKARSLTPDIPIGVLVRGIPSGDAGFAEELGAVSIHAGLSFVHRAFVDDAHRRGLKVFVYTVNHRDDLKRMRAMGVDGVFTNYPERVISGNG
ncbi:MAG: glycerophosphodiester phosphodiesterase family protein [Pseudomonadota bacterium]